MVPVVMMMVMLVVTAAGGGRGRGGCKSHRSTSKGEASKGYANCHLSGVPD
jgi:hypothetical protein